MVKPLSMALVVLAALTAPALAAEGSGCRCRYQGKYYDQGALVCIRVDGQAKLARCGMFLNNSTWQFVEGSCPSAMTTVPPGRLAGLATSAPKIAATARTALVN